MIKWLVAFFCAVLAAAAFEPMSSNVVLRVSGIRLGNCQSNEAGMFRYSSGTPQYYDGSEWRTFGGGGGALGPYPLFYIDLANTGFTELELKASTNNFAAVHYWFDSLGSGFTAWWNHAVADRICKLWYTKDSGNVTNRNPAVIVSPSLFTSSGSCSNWMTYTNANLVWSYRRRNAVAHEDAWHPIWPLAWVWTAPAPATVDDSRAWRAWDSAATLTEQLGYVPPAEVLLSGGGSLFSIPGSGVLFYVDPLGTTNTVTVTPL